MRKSLAAALIAASASTSACGSTQDGGPTISRNYAVSGFDQVDVAGPFDVTIHTGINPGVQARGSEKLIERLVVEVKDGKLLIHPEKRGLFGGWNSINGKADVVVTVPTLKGATLAGSGGISIDKVKGDSFDGQVAGSGDLHIGSIEVGSFKMGIAGSGNVSGQGRAQNADFSIAGSGGVDAKNIATETLKVSIAGAGDVRAHASKAADVSIMGSGDVEVTGGAKCSVSKAGAGDVRCS
jgi:hypothetical protein